MRLLRSRPLIQILLLGALHYVASENNDSSSQPFHEEQVDDAFINVHEQPVDDEIINLDDLLDDLINQEQEVVEVVDADIGSQENEKSEELNEQITITNPIAKTQTPLVVEDYLSSLSDTELEKICKERGFDVKGSNDDGTIISHEDYVEAARRCLNLDDEINAVLAKNPDLAAELEAEIDRMKQDKERLEAERDAMLREKEILEQKLKDSGVFVSANGTVIIDSQNMTSQLGTNGETPDALSVEEVLTESFRQLVEKVAGDVKILGSILSMVLKPLGKPLSIVWKYSQPTVDGIAQKALLQYVKWMQNEQVRTIVVAFSKPIIILWTTTFVPILGKMQQAVVSTIEIVKENEFVQTIGIKLEPVIQIVNEQLDELKAHVKIKIETAKESASHWVKETLRANSLEEY